MTQYHWSACNISNSGHSDAGKVPLLHVPCAGEQRLLCATLPDMSRPLTSHMHACKWVTTTAKTSKPRTDLLLYHKNMKCGQRFMLERTMLQSVIDLLTWRLNKKKTHHTHTHTHTHTHLLTAAYKQGPSWQRTLWTLPHSQWPVWSTNSELKWLRVDHPMPKTSLASTASKVTPSNTSM